MARIEFSEKFVNIISRMRTNNVAQLLMGMNRKNVEFDPTQNYIDIGSTHDELTFITGKKIKEIMGEESMKYVVGNRVKTLTHSTRNRKIFRRLGYTAVGQAAYKPEVGSTGYIKVEAKSNFSDNIYVLFSTDDGRDTVINKTCLGVYRTDKVALLWTKNRNPVKVGRIVRSLLKSFNLEFTEKDIELFVNDYKSAFDVIGNSFMKFKVIKGDNIGFWYNRNNYEHRGKSTLGGSCMAAVHKTYFDIYSKNSQCSLVVLFANDGEIKNGEYIASTIKGRALLWQTDQGDIFMDRIYTNNDSDVNLFKSFADSQGWWHKDSQNTAINFVARKGDESKRPSYTITLDNGKFKHYPYIDTFSYINFDNGVITNDHGLLNPVQGELHATNGYISNFYTVTVNGRANTYHQTWGACVDNEDYDTDEYDGDPNDEDED